MALTDNQGVHAPVLVVPRVVRSATFEQCPVSIISFLTQKRLGVGRAHRRSRPLSPDRCPWDEPPAALRHADTHGTAPRQDDGLDFQWKDAPRAGQQPLQ